MISYTSLHRRRYPQGLMNPGEVVMHEVERDGMGLVLDLLAERIGQPRHPAHAHPHREVLPFHKAR